LNSDDTAGIRNIYSNNNPRSYDAFNGANNSFTAAASLTGLIDANGNVLETGLNIATTSLKEYFTITAPSNTTGTMAVAVQSSGLSLLAPTLTVYNASQTQIGYVSGAGHYGTTLTLNITGVSAGQQFYVKVGGADSTSFGTGNYAMTFSFAGIAPPPVPLPNTQVLNGNPIHGGGGIGLQSGDGSGQDTSWDLFGQTVDEVTPAKSATVAQAPTSGSALAGKVQSEAVLSGSGLAFVVAPTWSENASPFIAATTLQAVFLVPVALGPTLTLVPPQAHLSRMENGSESNSIADVVIKENQVEQPAFRNEEPVAPPAVNAEPIGGTSEQAALHITCWRDACDACFVEESSLMASRSFDEGGVAATEDRLTAVGKPAATLAMLTLFGGWWSAQAERPDRFARRLLAL
jgi:hypothetical protein